MVAISSMKGVSAPAGAAQAHGLVPSRGSPPNVGGILPPLESMTCPTQPASAAILANVPGLSASAKWKLGQEGNKITVSRTRGRGGKGPSALLASYRVPAVCLLFTATDEQKTHGINCQLLVDSA